jgi:3-phosphoshikimate 1-carboxyvinyltransferase
MSLPEVIELIPVENRARSEVSVPGSKSITNRALILAALADGEVTLEGALWSEDTQIMVEGLGRLGFRVEVGPDPGEVSNATITVWGKGGEVAAGGTVERPLELFVGNAGTAARFLSALVCLGAGVYRLSGVPRMHERPQAAMFNALRQLGYRVEAEAGNDKLPAQIHGGGRRKTAGGPVPPACTVSIAESSQFASALLLCAKAGGWRIEVTGENADESPYVAMTQKLIESLPRNGGRFRIEPDASSGSYFWGAGWLLADTPRGPSTDPGDTGISRFETDFLPTIADQRRVLPVTVRHWPASDMQIDAQFPRYLPPPAEVSRRRHLGDSVMTAIVVASFSRRPARFVDLGRLRLQECERVMALRTELTRCGARVVEEGDTLTVHPSALHGAEIETYNDHRMAMCFAILGLKVPGIRLKNPRCVKKTFPDFFQKLVAPPPDGLGASILDGTARRALAYEELFVD